MDIIIVKEYLKGSFPYLDDISVSGSTQEDHDSNVSAFLKIVILTLINLYQYTHLLPSTLLDT